MKFFAKQLKENFLLKKAFFRTVNTPGARYIYKRAYRHVMTSKASKIEKPDGLTVEPYNVCNLKCVMCPYKEMKRKKVIMSMDLFKKIIDDAKSCGINNIGLAFYNEPLIDPLLFERIAYAKSKGINISFFSNGMLLTNEKIKQLLKVPPDRIVFSFDGATKATYESIRIGGNFDLAKENIKNLIEERNRQKLKEPRIQINFTIQKNNYKEAEEFRKFWEPIADEVDFGIADNRANEDVISSEINVKKPKEIYACRRLWNDMVIMSNGKVALCCIDYDGKIILGDINKQSIMDVWNGSEFKRIRKLHLDGKGNRVMLCQDCTQLYRQSTYSWWF